LTNGGALFATGQDIGYDIEGTNFYNNYLHATYLIDDTGIHALLGVPDDPIGDGLTISIQGGDGGNNQYWPDGISPRSPATTVFDYQGSAYDAGIKCETDGYRVVYFGFGFEAISTMEDRSEVMSRVLQWLLELPEPVPNLICEGELSWTDVEPGATVEGDFSIENDGEPTSLLDWEIDEYPEWGDWTFTPDSGGNLPGGDSITVGVEVVAPDEENTEFEGEIKIVNSENSSDFCIIPVYLKTPCESESVEQQWVKRIFQNLELGRIPIPFYF
jgi:hypothetical protein